jgi:hypothetical protein
MKKYFTSINIIDEKYIGTVFDQNTNQEIYKSKAYTSQSQALQDVNTFLVTSQPPTKDPVPSTIVNTTTPVPGAPSGQRRCCGR